MLAGVKCQHCGNLKQSLNVIGKDTRPSSFVLHLFFLFPHHSFVFSCFSLFLVPQMWFWCLMYEWRVVRARNFHFGFWLWFSQEHCYVPSRVSGLSRWDYDILLTLEWPLTSSLACNLNVKKAFLLIVLSASTSKLSKTTLSHKGPRKNGAAGGWEWQLAWGISRWERREGQGEE